MPIYEYIKNEDQEGCKHCSHIFKVKQSLEEASIGECPECSSKVRKVYSSFTIGPSKTGLDRRAKDSGFHKLKKVDKGKYEKLY